MDKEQWPQESGHRTPRMDKGQQGLGGLLLSMTSIMLSPVMGMQYTLIAIIVVVLVGLGNIKGSFIGGFILGLVGYVVSSSQPGLSMVAYYVIFLILLLVRPTGLLGK